MEITINQLINNVNLYPIAKWVLEVFLFIYAIVAIVVIRQIKFMTITIKSDTNKLIFLFAYFHLAIVVLTAIITIIIL